MSQISPPIRILLVLTAAVLGVYMLFLRPKDEVAPPATPAPNVQTGEPAVSGPGKAAEAAQGAVDAANGQLKAQESVDAGEASAATGTKAQSGANGANTAVASATDLSGLPKPIAKAIRKDKALVLLFWNGKSADDKAVHAALKHVDRWDGRVSVASAPIKKIARYGRVARGVDVEQSPTVVVVDPNLKAETLVGYVDAPTINQAVVDALRNTTGVFVDQYLRKVDAVCRDYRSEFNGIAHAYTGVPAEYRRTVERTHDVYTRFAADFAAVKAPKKWRAFKSATVADNQAAIAVYGEFLAVMGPKPTTARIIQGTNRLSGRVTEINKRYKARMRDERLTRCLN